MPIFIITFMSGLALVSGCHDIGGRDASYHPRIASENFADNVTNPYFPLVPGTLLKYIEKDRDGMSENEFAVTSDTKLILGVRCVVAHISVQKNDRVAEDTYEWFAQDKEGAVWCFGNATREISAGGKVSTEGSWQAGVNGALPGVFMPADPKPGPSYRQEYAPGTAEDMAEVVGIHESVTVPAGKFDDCVNARVWSMLELGGENKWYARGIGFVRSVSSAGEIAELVSVTRPSR